MTLNSLWTWGTENCSVTRPISLNKWLDNLLVKLYALLQHQNALQYVMSSSYSTVFWLLLYLTDKKKQENSIKHIFVYIKKIAVFKVFMFDVVTIRHKLSAFSHGLQCFNFFFTRLNFWFFNLFLFHLFFKKLLFIFNWRFGQTCESFSTFRQLTCKLKSLKLLYVNCFYI